ncbi:3-hydroxyacyl-CoA dehydrogenase NAD-binding domain-containing protein [Paragemmobacter ruber]|uniref:3-hydroxyacyl-CoA dehydrogenase n=1 Tax=Paragemmobacter ruber TaxID=1985673 RepID=A0ABW9YA66_9RHOB|nr:3-hydroxyacyl-CoA dehydrogenase NAD-binding domain-containing protein [Rhodobacter ruber]NBE09512.1 3-hydroxyacyl-CoA dehydrogenase [Rhodobacter ruber]
MTTKPKVALIGAGQIGRSWALLFARAGHPVAVQDIDPAQLDGAGNWLTEKGVTVTLTTDLGRALAGAAYVQENTPERLEIKQATFAALAPHLASDAILGSSTSALEPDVLFADAPFRDRALVVHPTNPPHVLPAVELARSQWTTDAALTETRRLMQSIGQDPLVLKRVLPGFVVNRLQAALVNEAMALVAQGVADPDEIDIAVRSALGLRWAFIGPFETMDLNSAGGFELYAQTFGAMFNTLRNDLRARDPEAWSTDTPARIGAARRAILPLDSLPARQAWRDAQVLRLRALKDTQ